MKIVIVGAGKVGYSLAQRLIQDDHDVYVIDRSPERIHNLENTLDVSLVLGNGSDVQLLNEIDMSDVGMFIAVTDSDEVNMLSCSVAKIKVCLQLLHAFVIIVWRNIWMRRYELN